MKVYEVTPSVERPQHAAGEVVWATVGNYLEDRNCDRKPRPAVILRAGGCQHWIAGLTTQATFKTTGESRVMVPVHRTCRLRGLSYLWALNPSRLCRLDVRSHIGWIDPEVASVLIEHMRLPDETVGDLLEVAERYAPHN